MNGQTTEKTRGRTKKWKEGYQLGSTVFKEVRNKKGKVDYYRCAVCGERYESHHFSNVYESHEIMHLLQRILAVKVSGKAEELIFEEDEE